MGGVLSLVLMSAQFPANGAIPAAHTCEGADQSPQLHWSGVPANAKSLALVVDDPMRPIPRRRNDLGALGLYNLPPTATSLPAGDDEGDAAAGNARGEQRWRQARLARAVSADRAASLPLQAVRARPRAARDLRGRQGQARRAMKGHVVAEGQLVGTYEKQKP